jgi:hypothetical protein
MGESSETGAGKALPDPGPGWLPQITLPMHGSARYMRVRLEVRDGMLRWEVPRALLGLVPIGIRHVVIPVREVGSVLVRRMVRPLRPAFGAAGIAGPLVVACLWGGWWWAVMPMAIIGFWVILVALDPHIEAVTRTGARHRAAVCFGHQIDAELYAAAVNDLAGQPRPSRPGGSIG